MRADDLNREQSDAIKTAIFRQVNYLRRLIKRMEDTGFPAHDPLYKQTLAAYDAVHRLWVDLHYRSCASGVGKPVNSPLPNS